MGKKDKKKGKGAEKTAAKTEKKLNAKQKKKLAATGEEDILKIIAEIEKEERAKQVVKEMVIEKPTRRANFSFISHPEKDELILFGGEFYNGKKNYCYNDLIFYNINKNEWTLTNAPRGPPRRCAHQMVAVSTNKGQLWLFGGEYVSESQNQFYHFRDLWVYHISEKRWEEINSRGGPSSRSGHRMCCLKKQIFVFGGYHDNLRDYKYYNDVYIFNLEDYTWKKIEPVGTPPPPRSACQMIPLAEGKILICGGYSKEKIKKDVDKGTIHTDMYLLASEKNDQTGLKWRWSIVKQGGVKMSPRCGTSVTLGPGNKAYSFGGVFDVEESEEDVSGTFFNDLNVLDLEKRMLRTVTLSGKKDPSQLRKTKRKDNEEEVETMDTEEPEPAVQTIADDGVFKVTIGPAPVAGSSSSGEPSSTIFTPPPRMNCGLAVKKGVLYLYGGLVEDGHKQFTLNDFYSLDIHKLEEWKIILQDNEAISEWLGSDSDESESDDEDSEDEEDVDSEEETQEMDAE